jgi:two-component system, NtrC family, response regulator PilR
MSNSNRKILVVDDEPGMRELLEIVFSCDGYTVHTAQTIEEGCAALEAGQYDVVVTDLRFGSDPAAGMEFLLWMEERSPETPAIMMTAHGTVENAIEAMKMGAADYILKPFANDEIRMIVQRAIEQRDLRRQYAVLRREQAKLGEVKNMIGASTAIEQVREMVRRVALLPSTVAIHGESGVGKELVARGIHQLSPRAENPFVAINCGGIPENLLESELFGHRKGAFTGAIEDKTGLFVAADGGTLFLDEIGEMPLSLQVKLLRVLDNSSVTPLGGTQSIDVDVRIISATNRDLTKMVADGSFREDLYYRLNVIPLTVPPLRERADDIPLLARHFVRKHSERMSRPGMSIGEDAMRALCAYEWPGNVRELGNMMERATVLCTGEVITLVDLPPNVKEFVPNTALDVKELPEHGVDLEELIADVEIVLIQQALERTRQSQKKASRLLGLTPRSLRYRLQKYGMAKESRESISTMS